MPATVEYCDDRHHRVAMAAEHEGGHVPHRHVEFLGEEMAEARAVEHAGHADDRVRAAGPENSRSAQTIASSGLVMQITKASGALALMPSPTAFITFRLMPSRSSRLMPGLRATPAVTMITSAPAMSA